MVKLSLFLALLACFTADGATNLIANNKKTDYVIVYSQREKYAAEELKFHLEKITGAPFEIIAECDCKTPPAKAFYLGDTAFAQKQGIKAWRFDKEEWFVKDYGKDIVITGGAPRGTLYGVYELAEKVLNCRYFAWDTHVYPPQNTLYLNNLKLAGRPSYSNRELVDDYHLMARSISAEVYRKTGIQRHRIRSSRRDALSTDVTKQYDSHHTFYFLLDPDKYFPTHPEYFSMDAKGKRFRGTLGYSKRQGGNLCLTNPQVLEIMWKNLANFIERDRRHNHSSMWPTQYPVSTMDSSDFICLCPNCKKISDREGSESGLLIHFLNQLAERADRDYPGVIIRSTAYVMTQKAPKHIRPRKNLQITWCNLYTLNDCYRPITSHFNVNRKVEFEDWIKSGVQVNPYEYWNMGGSYFVPACVETCIDAIISNIRYFHEHGCREYFGSFQADYDRRYVQNFAYLQIYVAYKLLLDVNSDPEMHIREFMKGYYGPAAEPMTKFLTLLRKMVRNEKMRMRAFERHRPYCTEAFMREVWGYLQEARRLTKPGSLYRQHVDVEMLTPINVILRNHWPIGDAAWMKKFYKDLRTARISDTRISPSAKKKLYERLETDMYSFVKVDLKVPEKFKDKEVIMMGWPYLRHITRKHTIHSFVNDSDAAGGKALGIPRQDEKLASMEQKVYKGFTPITFGIYDRETKRRKEFRINPIPQDEKYHWYEIGTYELGPQSFVWGFYWFSQCKLANIYQVADGLKDVNKWTVYISVKLTGPEFVKNSKKETNILWDQVMLVRDKKNYILEGK